MHGTLRNSTLKLPNNNNNGHKLDALCAISVLFYDSTKALHKTLGRLFGSRITVRNNGVMKLINGLKCDAFCLTHYSNFCYTIF